VLWQPLDQCPIKAQVVNLTEKISSGNTSCVFTRELNREPQQYSTNYLYKCSWSVLQLLYTYPNVHALFSCLLLIYHMSSSRLACHIHVSWCHTLNPTLNLCHPCIHHVYTMKNHVPWYHSISRLFPILLDSKSFQTTLDCSRPYDVMSCDFLVTCLLSLVVD